jgi:2-polyprenyl-3-methyl-5-hydroxy-6-metoxy-1,4-benzoquinol methylase
VNSPSWCEVADKWSEAVFNTLEHDRNRRIAKAISDAAASSKNKDAVDFGCGIGTYFRLLTKHFNRVVGVDTSPGCLSIAAQRPENVPCLRLTQPIVAKLRRSFDVAICINVLIDERRQARERTLRAVRFLLRAEAQLVLVVPSIESAGLLTDVTDGQYFDPWPSTLKTPEHGVLRLGGIATKHYSRGEVEAWLRDSGFELKRPIQRVSYSWSSHEITPVPRVGISPWDWLALARISR